MNILAATRDRKLFAPWFRKPDTWASWFSFLAALFALPMTPEQLVERFHCSNLITRPF